MEISRLRQRGGISNSGNLILTNDVLTGNFAGLAGGGLYNAGTATLANVILSNNSTQGNGYGGGGIFSTGSLTVANSFSPPIARTGAGPPSTAPARCSSPTPPSPTTCYYGALEIQDVAATVIGCTFTGQHQHQRRRRLDVYFERPGHHAHHGRLHLDRELDPEQRRRHSRQIPQLEPRALHDRGELGHERGGVYVGTSTPATLVDTIVAGNTVGGSESDIFGLVSGRVT